MSIERKVSQRVVRRAARVRQRFNHGKLRISVFRSLSHIYAQIIDDSAQKTMVSCSSLELKKNTGSKKEIAFTVGKELAKKAIEHGVTTAVFDRGPFLFHGRVKALADGLKEGGLQI